eukprot:3074353-Pyramimonas_sp.AAC.1
MQGPWTLISKFFGRGTANESGQGWTDEARMQGYPWGRLPILTVRVDCSRGCSRGGKKGSGKGG